MRDAENQGTPAEVRRPLFGVANILGHSWHQWCQPCPAFDENTSSDPTPSHVATARAGLALVGCSHAERPSQPELAGGRFQLTLHILSVLFSLVSKSGCGTLRATQRFWDLRNALTLTLWRLRRAPSKATGCTWSQSLAAQWTKPSAPLTGFQRLPRPPQRRQ